MELYTNDLVLRTVTNNDISEVARMWDFENGSIPVDEAQEAIDYMTDNHKKNRIGDIHHLCLAVSEKGKENIIGWCGLDGETVGKLHIFYSIDKAFRNKGYATQCAEKLLSYAFNEAQVPFVNGSCDKNNIASYRVMEKIGMIKDGYDENGFPLFFISIEMYQKNSKNTNRM